MDVGPQQDAIGWVIGLNPSVQRDVSGLEDLSHLATCQRAASPVRVQEYLPESALPTTSDNRREYSFASIHQILRIEGTRGVTLHFPSIDEHIRLRGGPGSPAGALR